MSMFLVDGRSKGFDLRVGKCLRRNASASLAKETAAPCDQNVPSFDLYSPHLSHLAGFIASLALERGSFRATTSGCS